MTGYEAAILDVDGTIVRGDRLLEGVTDGLATLEAAGISPLLFSNNPTRGTAHYRKRVGRHGIEIGPDRVLTSATVTAEYLSRTHDGDVVYLVGEERLATILRTAGLEVTDDPGEAELVVGSIDRSLSYDRLADALVALERDVPFYGTDPDATIPTEEGAVPGSGAVLAAMEAIAGREPDAILGKPSPVAAEAAIERLGTDPATTLVVGDRLDTDVALGARAGMTTAVVLTGLTTRADLEQSSIEPDYVLESLADLETILEE